MKKAKGNPFGKGKAPPFASGTKSTGTGTKAARKKADARPKK